MNAYTPRIAAAPRYRTREECYQLACPMGEGKLFQASRQNIADAMFAICGPGATKLADYEIKRVGSGVVL